MKLSTDRMWTSGISDLLASVFVAKHVSSTDVSNQGIPVLALIFQRVMNGFIHFLLAIFLGLKLIRKDLTLQFMKLGTMLLCTKCNGL